MRNEALKTNTYNQYWKQSPSDQSRLLSTFYYKTRKMEMNFVQPKVKHPKTLTDYKKSPYEVQADDLHPIDQIEFHKQDGEIL